MCDQDQDRAFVAPGYDENLHACDQCNDSGISMEDGSYCKSCRMGKRIEQLDIFAAELQGHSFKEACRIVFRSTQKTEKALAAAERALLEAKLYKAERARQLAEARAFEMSAIASEKVSHG